MTDNNCCHDYHTFCCGKKVRVKHCPHRTERYFEHHCGSHTSYPCDLKETLRTTTCHHRPNHLLKNCVLIQQEIAEKRKQKNDNR